MSLKIEEFELIHSIIGAQIASLKAIAQMGVHLMPKLEEKESTELKALLSGAIDALSEAVDLKEALGKKIMGTRDGSA